ncbi:MAG: hypothetical protein MHM6MM_007373, partial [Cercozoa sp. M6MM]
DKEYDADAADLEEDDQRVSAQKWTSTADQLWTERYLRNRRLPVSLRELLEKLPPPPLVQGDRVHPGRLMQALLNADLSRLASLVSTRSKRARATAELSESDESDSDSDENEEGDLFRERHEQRKQRRLATAKDVAY